MNGSREFGDNDASSDLPARCFTFPENDDGDAEHVYFTHSGTYFKHFLDSSDRIYNECTTRMYDRYTFRVLVRLGWMMSKLPRYQLRELGQITPATFIMPILPGVIEPQFPSNPVLARIKHLRPEILLDANPKVNFGLLSRMSKLKHLYLKILWVRYKQLNQVFPAQGNPYYQEEEWTQAGIDALLNDVRWTSFLRDLLMRIPRTASVHILGGRGWSKESEGTEAVTVDSMRARLGNMLKLQGQKPAA